MPSLGFILAIALALVHGFISRIEVDAFIPQYRWISFAGGVSMGYVFLDIFPELSHAQEELAHVDVGLLNYLENHVYLLALLGLTLFYGLDRWVILSRQGNQADNNTNQADTTIFWIHMSAFALINLIFGYLLQDLVHSLGQCLLFFIAAALHFFIVDHSLREHHRNLYDKQGRWLLTAAIVVGAIAGESIKLHEATISIIWAFLAGSILLNILKKELPEAQETCFWSFLGGATLYSGLILLI